MHITYTIYTLYKYKILKYRLKTEEFRSKLFNDGVTLDSLLIETYAVVREASWRVLQLRHFDVQLVGGMALHNGRLAEMATGVTNKTDTVMVTF